MRCDLFDLNAVFSPVLNGSRLGSRFSSFNLDRENGLNVLRGMGKKKNKTSELDY